MDHNNVAGSGTTVSELGVSELADSGLPTPSPIGEAYDDETGRPLEGVTVTLVGIGSRTTDARGRFSFADSVAAGRYTIALEKTRMNVCGNMRPM